VGGVVVSEPKLTAEERVAVVTFPAWCFETDTPVVDVESAIRIAKEHLAAGVAEVTKEHNNARAEVEKSREYIERLTDQRDEARAEIERLRAQLREADQPMRHAFQIGDCVFMIYNMKQGVVVGVAATDPDCVFVRADNTNNVYQCHASNLHFMGVMGVAPSTLKAADGGEVLP
jgi:hypothetical protein